MSLIDRFVMLIVWIGLAILIADAGFHIYKAWILGTLY